MLRCVVCSLVSLTLLPFVANGQVNSERKRAAPSLTVELISPKREYKVGEQWVGELKATANSGAEPLTIRAWSRFFGEYQVIPEIHGPIEEANLSDVLSAGENIWRDGEPVVLRNSPVQKIFNKASRTKVQAGTDVNITFNHHFGSALKAGRFRRKLWFAIVVEPVPNESMLLFAREPIDVEFVVRGEEIDSDTASKQSVEWFKLNGRRLHTSFSVQGAIVEPLK